MEVKYKIFRVDLTHEYVPDGYSTAHLAHPNLRDCYAPYDVELEHETMESALAEI